MRIRIATERVTLGMYIAGVDCSWMQSPFWRQRFLLDNPADLVLLRSSGIRYVTIDTDHGVAPAIDRAPSPSADRPDEALVERRDAPRIEKTGRGETERARRTLERSKQAVMQLFGQARLGQAVAIAEVAPLVDEIAESMLRDRSAMLSVTRLKTKNEYTYLHSVAVCALMMNLARQLGLDEAEVRQLGLAGLLHDVGKMAIPEEVLNKPGRLEDDEFALIRTHPNHGHAMLADAADVGPIALDVCLHHHEKVDGTGYPFGLTASEISLHARMGAVCDVYDAITSDRPYKHGWPANEALARMLEWEGHFDADILQAFIRSIGIHPRDGLVRTFSNRLGLVLAAGDSPETPMVRIFYDVPTDQLMTPVDVDTRNVPGSDPIIGAERWPYWFGDDWRETRAAVKRGEQPEDRHSSALRAQGEWR